MNLFRLLVSLTLVLSTASYANAPRVKILPLGDSISCASTQKLSYRYPLWKSLVDKGKPFAFVGSQLQKGNGGRHWQHYKGRHFPRANEGHSGWRADQILKGLDDGTAGLSSWLVNYTPDIVLIHLGTNDLMQSQSPESTVDDIEKIIVKIRKRNPKVKVLLAKIMPIGKSSKVPWLNQLIGRLAIKLNQPSSPVRTVDMYSGMNFQSDMERDKIHPNARGEVKLASRWLNALIQNKYL